MKVPLLVALLSAGALGACSESAPSSGSAPADCGEYLVRLDGVVYADIGFTSARARRFGTALEASCNDVGSDPSETSFDSRSQDVQVWSFEGFNTSDLLGIKSGDQFRAMAAESLDEQSSLELLDAVSEP